VQGGKKVTETTEGMKHGQTSPVASKVRKTCGESDRGRGKLEERDESKGGLAFMRSGWTILECAGEKMKGRGGRVSKKAGYSERGNGQELKRADRVPAREGEPKKE